MLVPPPSERSAVLIVADAKDSVCCAIRFLPDESSSGVSGAGMAVLRVPSFTHRYDEHPVVTERAHPSTRVRIRCAIALLVYSTSYPLLGFALWIGARDGEWVRTSFLVALGVFMSLLGWGLLSSIGEPKVRSAPGGRWNRPVDVTVFLALYNRAGAIVVLVESYAVAAMSQDWPHPQTFVGWFALVFIPLLAAFCTPIKRSTVRDDNE
jgi:hypothetical protein